MRPVLLYGGTYSQFAVTLPQDGDSGDVGRSDDPENFQRALQPNTRLVYAETLGNPKINVLDIEPIAAIAHNAQIPLMIDNTMASPYLCRPFDWGADIVVHSATKYIGGHGTTHRRRVGRKRKVRLGQRQVSRHGGAVEGLSRCQVLGNIR